MLYILLKNGLVLTFKNEDPEPLVLRANVLVENDTIIDVKPGLEATAGSEAEVVDCTGKWITPGQIDTHWYVNICFFGWELSLMSGYLWSSHVVRRVWMSIMRGQHAD